MDSRLTQLGDEIRVVGDGALNAATKYFNLFCAKREEDIDIILKFLDIEELQWHRFKKSTGELFVNCNL